MGNFVGGSMQEGMSNWRESTITLIQLLHQLPVTNPNIIHIVWMLLAMIPEWIAIVIDVEGVFLQGKFTNGEQMHIDVPDGMNKFYGSQEDVVLLLNVRIYSTKQAAQCFYQTLVRKGNDRNYHQSKANPCL